MQTSSFVQAVPISLMTLIASVTAILIASVRLVLVSEREMDIQPWYQNKIKNYSHMQYAQLHNRGLDFKPNNLGYEFFNMGMILLNSKQFKPYLQGQDPSQFL